MGLSLAFAGIPFYGTVLGICSIPAPPLARSWVPSTWLHIVPIFTAITYNCVLILCVWFKVHRQVVITSRWKFRANRCDDVPLPQQESHQNRDLSPSQNDWLAHVTKRRKEPAACKKSTLTTIQRVERTVMWQALFYVVAFYACWICQLVLIKTAPHRKMPYSFYCAVMILIPLQGFLNSLNYYRPRAERYFRDQRERCERKQSYPGGLAFSRRCSPPENDESPRQPFRIDRESSDSLENISGQKKQSEESTDIKDIFDTIVEPSAYLEQSHASFGKDSTSDCDDDNPERYASGLLKKVEMASIVEGIEEEGSDIDPKCSNNKSCLVVARGA